MFHDMANPTLFVWLIDVASLHISTYTYQRQVSPLENNDRQTVLQNNPGEIVGVLT